MTKTKDTFPVVAKQLNEQVLSVIGNDAVLGFERAYLVADAVQRLNELLTPEYMKPIMALQGTALGFRTDRDRNSDGSKGPGYPEAIVKNCLIEAVLSGLDVTGNQFNIIAGNTYATKNGVKAQLKKIHGLIYDITHELPRVDTEQKKAAVIMNITWKVKGTSGEKKLDFPIKLNSMMGTDAIIGKATRKARKWLFEHLTGIDIPDADVADYDGKTIVITGNGSTESKEVERIKHLIDDATTIEELKAHLPLCIGEELEGYYEMKKLNLGA